MIPGSGGCPALYHFQLNQQSSLYYYYCYILYITFPNSVYGALAWLSAWFQKLEARVKQDLASKMSRPFLVSASQSREKKKIVFRGMCAALCTQRPRVNITCFLLLPLLHYVETESSTELRVPISAQLADQQAPRICSPPQCCVTAPLCQAFMWVPRTQSQVFKLAQKTFYSGSHLPCSMRKDLKIYVWKHSLVFQGESVFQLLPLPRCPSSSAQLIWMEPQEEPRPASKSTRGSDRSSQRSWEGSIFQLCLITRCVSGPPSWLICFVPLLPAEDR